SYLKKWPPKPEIEINVNKDEEREDKEILDILEVLMKKEKLARDGEVWIKKDNNRAVGVNDCIDGDKLLIEEKEEIIDNKKELTEKKLNYVCELWSEKVTKFRQRVEWDKNDRLKKEYWYLNDLETGIDDNKAKSLDKKMGDTDETIVGKEDNSEDDDGKKLLGRSLIVLVFQGVSKWSNEVKGLPVSGHTEIKDVLNIGDYGQNKIWKTRMCNLVYT
ncbi:17132_t:CDS:2, partial [Gigaspora rosea]